MWRACVYCCQHSTNSYGKVSCTLYTYTVMTTYTKETLRLKYIHNTYTHVSCIMFCFVLFWFQTLLYAYKYIESAVIRHTDPTKRCQTCAVALHTFAPFNFKFKTCLCVTLASMTTQTLCLYVLTCAHSA